jgi:poly-gamma-glutamate synthesis protein (capsule biosynthesis protein)
MSNLVRVLVGVSVALVVVAAPTAGVPPPEPVVIALMGDTMLGRLVSRTMSSREPTYYWGTTLPLLKESDLRILNLETTITTSDTKWTGWKKAFYYRAVPRAIDVLKAADIDYLNLANNHILDFSEAGLKETIQRLDQAGILHTGAGLTPDEAERTVGLTAGNLSIGVFSFADHYPQWSASKRGAGIFFVPIPPDDNDWRRLKEMIRRLDRQHDWVVLSVHWGPNMRDAPSDKVVRFAHQLIDEGVDVIHGHSAHVFHGVEIYQGKVILYDTGEFIDDYAVHPVMRNDYSFLYLLTVKADRIERVELIPVVIQRMQVNVATGRDRARIHELFAERTRRFQTSYGVDGGRIVIPVQ